MLWWTERPCATVIGVVRADWSSVAALGMYQLTALLLRTETDAAPAVRRPSAAVRSGSAALHGAFVVSAYSAAIATGASTASGPRSRADLSRSVEPMADNRATRSIES